MFQLPLWKHVPVDPDDNIWVYVSAWNGLWTQLNASFSINPQKNIPAPQQMLMPYFKTILNYFLTLFDCFEDLVKSQTFYRLKLFQTYQVKIKGSLLLFMKHKVKGSSYSRWFSRNSKNNISAHKINPVCFNEGRSCHATDAKSRKAKMQDFRGREVIMKRLWWWRWRWFWGGWHRWEGDEMTT